MKMIRAQYGMSIGFRQRLFGAVNEQCEAVAKNEYCSASVYNWRMKWIAPAFMRYGRKHIGIGTKRYIDSLGGC